LEFPVLLPYCLFYQANNIECGFLSSTGKISVSLFSEWPPNVDAEWIVGIFRFFNHHLFSIIHAASLCTHQLSEENTINQEDSYTEQY
jgi:hypothetical protein